MLNFGGLFIKPDLAQPIAQVESTRKIVPGYDFRLQSTEPVKKLLREPMVSFDLAQANETIFRSIVHHDQRGIQPYDNYLLWLGGKFYPPLKISRQPERIVAGGIGICSDKATIMYTIARRNNLDARFVGLQEHVVCEVKTAQGWQVADPDYGVVFSQSAEQLQQPENRAVLRTALEKRGFDDATVTEYVRYFQTKQDNVWTPVNQPISPRLYQTEMVADWLKWILPMLLILPAWLRPPQRVTKISA